MATELARRSTALAVPTREELEALGPGDRWTLEERLDEAGGVLRQFNDDELRHWVEVEGRTQREIASMVGRSKSRIGQRCARLGLVAKDNRGGSRLPSPGQNESDDDDGEVLDAEVVDEDSEASPPPQSSAASGPAYRDPPARGVRSAAHQAQLITSVARRMEDIETSIGEIDQPTAITALEEGERHQCLSQLRGARTAVSQLIRALE